MALSKQLTHEELIQAQVQKDQSGNKGVSVAGPQEWANAWKQKQADHYSSRPPLESYSDPTPLLMDKISSLPPSSARRRNAENMVSILDNSTANVGYGTDALTRESYKDLIRLVEHSEMMQLSISSPMPTAGDLIGQEGGTVVSNLQSWQPSVSNAVRPVSDAIGSHADINSSIDKTPLGPNQLLPQTALIGAKGISNDLITSTENPFKGIQKGVLVQLPSKETGSLRHLATAASPILSVPFEMISDTYNGLMGIVNKAAKILDGIINKIVNFAISAVGGLVDSLFPPGMLSKLVNMVTKIINTIQQLFDMLGGFSALAKMSAQIIAELPLGCTGNIFGLKGGPPSAKSKARAAKIGSVIGTVAGLGTALGNLGAMAGGSVPPNLGAITPNIAHPSLLTENLFDSIILKLIKKLHQSCSVGRVGNRGYSVGDYFDSLTDTAYTAAMKSYAAHSSIIAPNFNKTSTPIGSYSMEPSVGFFDQLPYGPGAQGNKGVIMYGPGGTRHKKVFRI